MNQQGLSLSCVVHTRNSEATLDTALASVAWADELIVADMDSRDATREIAARHEARVLPIQPAPRVDVHRNLSSAQARHEWVFMLDADEKLAADAEGQIAELLSEHAGHYDAFGIPRYNEVAGRVLRGGRWYPDHQVRLFRKGSLRWCDATHEPPVPVGGPSRVMYLQPPGCLHLHHANYADLTGFIEKQLRYALDDRYATDAADFDFQDYLARAYDAMGGPVEPEVDADLGEALALVLAWDQVVRGLIHWDRLDPKPPLGRAMSLPLAPMAAAEPEGSMEALQQAYEKLARTEAELTAVKGTLAWRTHAAIERRFPRLVGALARWLRS